MPAVAASSRTRSRASFSTLKSSLARRCASLVRRIHACGAQASSTSAMMSASSRVFFSSKPRCVIQGVPRRMPLGSAEFLSPGMVLRLTTMPTTSRMRAAWSPLRAVPSAPLTLVHVHVEHVAVGAAERDAQSALLELVGHGLGVLDGLRLQFLELRRLRQLEGQGQRGEDVDVRAALLAGEDGLVELLGDVRVGGQQHRAARAVQRSCAWWTWSRGHADGRGHDARRHQAADVRDVRQEVRADLVRDLAELLPVGHPRIGGVAGDDQLGLVFRAPACGCRRSPASRSQSTL